MVKKEVFDALPLNVKVAVREWVAANVHPEDDPSDTKFHKWLESDITTPHKVMDAYLKWEGVIGFTTDIMFAAEELLREEIIRIHEEDE